MRANKLKKIAVGFLIFSQAALIPASALAVVSTATGSLNPVPINDTGSTLANSLFDGPFTAQKALYTGCNAAIKTFEATDNASQLGFSFSSIIGGGGTLAAQLAAEMAAYNTYLNPPCLTSILTTLNGLTAPNTYTSTLKQQLVTQIKADTQTYQAKLKETQARYNVASQNIWKAVLITVLINTTKGVANQLVGKLVNNYKIANIKAYTDSVATLAYDNQFIRGNFPDAQSQMMARAVLVNPIFRNQIQPGVYVAAGNNLGFDPATLDVKDPNYYAKLAMVGSAQANPYYMQSALVAGVDQSRAGALLTAQNQISQGNGYKAPVSNCAQSLQQQKMIDAQAKAVSDQLGDRKALFDNLLSARQAGQPVEAADIEQARADYSAAASAWNNLPKSLNNGSPAMVMCEAVSSPAALVNQGIDSLFKSVSANMSQYNSSNLPGFLNAISGIATQIGSSMVLGGISGSSTLNENQIIGQGVTATTAATINTIFSSSSSPPSIQSQVNGAYAAKPILSIRGPVGIAPRGPQ